MLPASIVAAQAATDGAAQSHHHALDDTHLDMEENGLHKMAAFLAAPAEGEAGLIITGGPTLTEGRRRRRSHAARTPSIEHNVRMMPDETISRRSASALPICVRASIDFSRRR